MLKDDDINHHAQLAPKKNFFPKRHTPWDALEDFAKSLIPPHIKNELEEKINNGVQNSVHNGIQNGVQNDIHNGIQNGYKTEKIEKRYTKQLETVYKKDLNGIQNSVHNGIQFHSQKEVDPQIVHSISGIKRRILMFIVEMCLKSGGLVTSPINCKELATALNEKYASTKQAISRLKNDRLIESVKTKDGRGGFACFKITEAVKFYVLEHKKKYEILNHSVAETVYKQETKRYTDSRSSSLDLNYNTTNYLNGASPHEPEFNLEPLAEIGFTENHAKQILKQGKLTAEEIQESIDHFAFDLAYNDKLKTIKTNPLAFFMGTLKKGDYYNPASNYESQKARNMRLSLEAKMQCQQAEKELEDKLKEVEWKEWSEGLTEQELMEFYVEQTPMAAGIPERVQKTLKRKNALANAREYFEGEVWPRRKKRF